MLGVTDPDGGGVSGLELGLQDQLRKSDGKVATSLDMRVQFIVADEMAKAREKFRAVAAGAIVMDVNSGEVLAMVSLPDFDPNLRRMAPGDSQRNIMAQDVYRAGLHLQGLLTFHAGSGRQDLPSPMTCRAHPRRLSHRQA